MKAGNVLSFGLLPLLAGLGVATSSSQAADSGDAKRCTVERIQSIVGDGAVIETVTQENNPVRNCRIDGYVTTLNPGPNKVRFRLQLPTDNFNGRLYMAGLGGAAGYVPTDSQVPRGNPIVAGFAMAGTDTGHSGETLDWSFIGRNAAQTLDYDSRGGHVVAVVTQKITRDYYGIEKLYRYHSGCSGGGRMGVRALESHPDDYDGILIGAPGRSTANMLMFMWASQQMQREPGSWLSPAKLSMVEQRVTAQCDATDGAVDGVVWNPEACKFNTATLLCKLGQPQSECLTRPELTTLDAIHEGPRDPAGRLIHPGMPLTNTAAGWGSFLGTTPPPWNDSIRLKDMATSNAATVMGHVLSRAYFGDSFNFVRDFDFRNQAQVNAWWVAARRTGWGMPHKADLSDAEKAGTKVIWWHGTSDAGPVFPTSTEYLRDAQRNFGGSTQRLANVVRFYPVPGMLHCGGGTGPDDAPDRLLWELIDWVEKGKTPGAVVTGRGVGKANYSFIQNAAPGVSGVQIPTSVGAPRGFLLCPAPLVSKFHGPRGAEFDAAQWSCEKPS